MKCIILKVNEFYDSYARQIGKTSSKICDGKMKLLYQKGFSRKAPRNKKNDIKSTNIRVSGMILIILQKSGNMKTKESPSLMHVTLISFDSSD
mmetsp:Transcript_31704/g.47266  ORF Transcript_31704/g.47266 Transcript_31704/m.47266 type:complete len:93 (+) Transcript_31704:1072-1350(+)